MTQTIALNGATPEINPLYIKMRRRFAVDGDRTIGEAMAQKAIHDGYHPYASPARKSANASERHVTRANSLPTPQKASHRSAQHISLSRGSLAVIILSAFLLLVLLFAGMYISDLNRALNEMQNGGVMPTAEERGMSLIPEDVYTNGAEMAEESSHVAVYEDNLIKAFTK